MSYSIEILTDRLNEHKNSLKKSLEYCNTDPDHIIVYNIHASNLEPKIRQLEIDINKLKQ